MMRVRECLFIVYMRIPYKSYQELEDFSSFHYTSLISLDCTVTLDRLRIHLPSSLLAHKSIHSSIQLPFPFLTHIQRVDRDKQLRWNVNSTSQPRPQSQLKPRLISASTPLLPCSRNTKLRISMHLILANMLVVFFFNFCVYVVFGMERPFLLLWGCR